MSSRFDDIVPVGESDSYWFGFTTGQRACRAYAFMTDTQLASASWRSWLKVMRSMMCARDDYRRGYENGYVTEREGIAHPLPLIDVPSHYNDVNN